MILKSYRYQITELKDKDIMKKMLILLLVILPWLRIYGGENSPTTNRILSNNQIGFLQNNGQWKKEILFLNNIHGAQKQVITPDACITVVETYPNRSISLGMSESNQGTTQVSVGLRFLTQFQDLKGKNQLNANTHFILGNNTVQNIPFYSNIYGYVNNTPCEISTNQSNIIIFSLFFNRTPSFDYTIEGISHIELKDSIAYGTTIAGIITINKPLIFGINEKGEKELIDSKWEVNADGKCSIRSESSSYHSYVIQVSQPSFSTLLSGTNDDEASTVQVDSTRSIYVAGESNSQDFPTSGGAFQTSLKNSRDCFVTKYSADGSQMIFSTFIGGDGIDRALDIAVRNDGSVYLTGSTTSNNFPLSANPFQNKRKNLDQGSDAFILVLNNDGKSIRYSTYLGGQVNDAGESIALDKAGFIYITGKTDGPKEFPIKDGFQNTFGGGTSDGFIAKLSQDLSTLMYSSFLGGELDDYPTALTVNDSGSVFVVGQTQSRTFPVTPFTVSNVFSGGIFDSFISRISHDGKSIVYSALIGGSGDESATNIVIDIFNNAYVVGNTTSGNFPRTVIAADTSFNGKNDAFCYKVSPNGNRYIFSSLIGGSNDDYARSVSIDPCFAVYVTGYTNSADMPVSDNPIQNQLQGEYDGFLTKINADGNLFVYGTYVGGSSDDKCLASTVDSTGAVMLVGYTSSANFPNQTSYKGKKDAFITKIQVGILPLSPKITADGPLSFCAENGFVTLDVGAGYRTYQWKKNNDIIPGATSARYTAFESGIYTIEVIDLSGCTGINNVEVRAFSPPQITLTKKNIICPDSSVLLSLNSQDSLRTYRWIPTLGLSSDTVRSPLAKPPVTTMYTVIVSDTNGCSSRDSLWVYVVNPNSIAINTPIDTLEVCPSDSIAINIALKNTDIIERDVQLSTMTSRFIPKTTIYSLLSNKDTTAYIQFKGNAVPGLYKDTLTVTDICGNTKIQPLFVRVGTPNIRIMPSNDTTVCANEAVRRSLRIRNNGTIGAAVRFSADNPLFAFQIDTTFVKSNDSVSMNVEFKGASPGIYTSLIYTEHQCGSTDSVEIRVIVEGNPVVFSLSPNQSPQTVGSSAFVDIIVDNAIILDTAKNKTMSLVVHHEKTSLELKNITSNNCNITFTSNDSTTTISLTACRDGLTNPIATLEYLTVIGNTLRPEIQFNSITIGDRCIDPNAMKSTVAIKPFGCEIKTLEVQLFESKLQAITPNPSQEGYILVDFSCVEEIPTTITLRDMVGSEVYRIDNASLYPGTYRAFIPTQGLNEGLYLVTFNAGFYVASLPVLIK